MTSDYKFGAAGRASASRKRWRCGWASIRITSMPAFEDPFYHLQQERQLPINVDPVDNHLEDPQERERIRHVFERGLDTPVGMVLPLQRGPGKSGPEWQTGLWMLRGQHLYLVPGDSPVGLRLPLPSLPWVAPEDAPRSSCAGSDGESRTAAGSAAACADATVRVAATSRKADGARPEAEGGRIGALGRAHGAVRRAARRAAARFHAAGG